MYTKAIPTYFRYHLSISSLILISILSRVVILWTS